MKKWSILFFVFLCIVIWLTVSVYRAAMDPKQSLIEKARERAAQKVSFAYIDDTYTYYGEKNVCRTGRHGP